MFLLYIYGNIIKYRCVRYIYIKINLKQGRAGGVLNSRAGLVFLKVLVNKFIYIFYKAPLPPGRLALPPLPPASD